VTATKVPPEAPAATSPERTLASVASDGVSFLVYWLVILLLAGQAVTTVLRPPEGAIAVGLLAGLICLVWATFCLTMGILRGPGPNGADVPPPAWLVVITTAGCLISLAILRAATGMTGPWPAEVVAVGLLVASLTVWRGPLVGGISAVVLAAAMLVIPLGGAGDDPLLRASLSDAVPAIAVVAAGFAVALALYALGRTAGALQRSLDERDEVLIREHAVRAATQVSAEVERSLHDTALNTLETIAAHGDHIDAQAVVQRCRADYDQLAAWRSEATVSDLPDLLRRLEVRGRQLGLDVEVALVGAVEGHDDAAGSPWVEVPQSVIGAMAGAGAEALTNVAKHAGVDHATVLVNRDPGGVQVFVADDGVGPGPAPGGFGVSRSIRARMDAVGGSALIGPGPHDRGTVVLLEWHPVPPPPQQIGSDLLARIAGIVLMIATFLAGVASALVVLGWSAYSRPGLALAGAVAPVLVGAWILGQAREGRRVGNSQVVAACATYVAVGAVTLLADPYCSSLLGEGVILDARAPMMALLLLLAPRPGVLGSLVATVGLTHLGAALAWNQRWLLCGPDTATAGVYVVAALAAAWLFVERIDRVSAQLATARDQARSAQVRMSTELGVRAEEELWVAETLASAQDLLDDIATGRRDPADRGTRSDCAAQAEFLRALLAVGQAPMSVRRPARIWLRLLNSATCPIRVRGSFEGCQVPPRVVGEVGGVIDVVCALAPGATVTLSSWSEPDPTIVVSVQGPQVGHAAPALLLRIDRVASDAWCDATPEEITLEWRWTAAVSSEVGVRR
jgi:hypothetical protein